MFGLVLELRSLSSNVIFLVIYVASANFIYKYVIYFVMVIYSSDILQYWLCICLASDLGQIDYRVESLRWPTDDSTSARAVCVTMERHRDEWHASLHRSVFLHGDPAIATPASLLASNEVAVQDELLHCDVAEQIRLYVAICTLTGQHCACSRWREGLEIEVVPRPLDHSFPGSVHPISKLHNRRVHD